MRSESSARDSACRIIEDWMRGAGHDLAPCSLKEIAAGTGSGAATAAHVLHLLADGIIREVPGPGQGARRLYEVAREVPAGGAPEDTAAVLADALGAEAIRLARDTGSPALAVRMEIASAFRSLAASLAAGAPAPDASREIACRAVMEQLLSEVLARRIADPGSGMHSAGVRLDGLQAGALGLPAGSRAVLTVAAPGPRV